MILRAVAVSHRENIDVNGLACGCMVMGKPTADRAAPVSALGDITIVAQNVGHKFIQRQRHAPRTPRLRWRSGKTEARQGRRDNVKRIIHAAAKSLRMRQRLNDVPELGN